MEKVIEQKCSACGAMMRFDPEKGLLVCDYCGTTAEIAPEQTAPETEVQEAGVEGFDFNSLLSGATDAQAPELPIYNCVSCGAEIIAAPEQFALTCPYCRNNIVLSEKVSGNLRPDGVVPFRITPKQLPDAMTRFYRKKALLPKNFFSESTMGKVTGVYVPFWLFSGRVYGNLNYAAETVSRHMEGNYEVTDVHHFLLDRDVSVGFRDLPVDASGRIDDALMDSLEPFDTGELKPFDIAYLSGFTADRFDVAAKDIAERAEQRMRTTAERAAAAEAGAGYSGVRRRGGSLRADIDAKYVLLPVYLFDILHGGVGYHFAVNGQTGKVVGSVPTDKGVSRRYFLLRAAAVLAGVLLISFIGYMLGR